MTRDHRGLAAAVLCSACVLLATGCGSDATTPTANGKHVLLLSIDGMHESDLAGYITSHPQSALAKLVGSGTQYTHAQTTIPSDSFPGMVAQVTGGTPKTTGIYYDDTFNHDLLKAGTTNCAGVAPGAAVELTEDLDKDKSHIDAGEGLPNLPDGVIDMTGDPTKVIDSANLPVDPKTCKPVEPGNYLQVNTIFSVAHKAGLRTAWSDKHPAYAILNGPGGTSIDDLFTPEINSATDGTKDGKDWTSDNALTQRYDTYKADAVVHQIDGKDHSSRNDVGVPAIFGMNFQSVSTAEKLPTSGGKTGGYEADGVTPGPVLASALDFVDKQVGRFVDELKAKGQSDNTTIIVSAKHGQGPMKPDTLNRIDDGKIIDGLNAAWAATHPDNKELITHSVDDDAMIMWLSDRSADAATFAKNYLLGQSGNGTDIAGNPKPFHASGLDQVYAGTDAAGYFGTKPGDSRVPDIYATTQPGTVFTAGKSKIAEHGGVAADDRNVPLVVAGATGGHTVIDADVATAQIAPTVLQRLGLNPDDLQAVAAEHTAVLPN
ncbi:alkaline phosphatase family protein [Antrihabitans cavernicola]|uniref:Alkaline phosphatase family protein n=1 Tax=Antrihabitans cavernicola TaxID=2495913 RepID=A0A5A7SDS1_9NOCA|nr:alkaline phosphatase family protein [Spelaeibacter cavernicola]KAA0022361.1 alkaline phosphatase family protein [Spelaeibacter cavernicola]